VGKTIRKEDTAMKGFTAQRFWFTVEVKEPIEWFPFKGPSIRGALFGALRKHYCPAPDDPDPAHSAICPVCWLLAREEPNWTRMRTPPKAYTIEPPLETKTRYEPGESFSFGITLFGQATNLFPYLVLAVPMMGEAGIGKKVEENRWRRGRFTLKLIEEVNPLTGQRKVLKDATSLLIQAPENPVEHRQVEELGVRSEELGVKKLATHHSQLATPNSQLLIRFLTPTRIIEGGHLVKRPLFTPLFHRLLERLEALSIAYGDGAPEWDKNALLALADKVRLVEDRTHWVDIKSFSNRLGRSTPAGGFVGEAVYEAEDWRPLLPWLIWGTITHVGKNAVKGCGMYELGVRSEE